MRVRRLDDNNDMTFGAGSLNFFKDATEGVAQNIYTRLKLWLGEWFLNTDDGTDWSGRCLGKNSVQSAEAEIRQRILNTAGVLSINDLTISVDDNTRAVSVNGSITTEFGKTTINFNGSYSIRG